MTLTKEQRQAAEARGFVLVEAGPGTGKTRTLAARISHLVRERGVAPSSILALTFTRSACHEILSRADKELGFEAAVPLVRTFDAFAAALVLRDSQRIATLREADAAVRSLYHGPTKRPPGDVPGVKSLRENIIAHRATEPEPAPLSTQIATGGRAIPYAGVGLVLNRLSRASLVPLWDLVPRALSTAWPDGARFNHVLIDEWQDVTSAEVTLAKRALAAPGELFAVGDPKQAIMGWRGSRGFEGFATHHLTHSFRFGPMLASAANWFADRFGGGHVEGLQGAPGDYVRWDFALVPELVSKGVEGVTRQELGKILILARTRHDCQVIEREINDATRSHVAPQGDDPLPAARRAVHNPTDPLASDSDLFGDIWRRGQAVISTVHAAKGREADTVIVALELDDEADTLEECKIAYVAATRARRRLLLVTPPSVDA